MEKQIPNNPFQLHSLCLSLLLLCCDCHFVRTMRILRQQLGWRHGRRHRSEHPFEILRPPNLCPLLFYLFSQFNKAFSLTIQLWHNITSECNTHWLVTPLTHFKALMWELYFVCIQTGLDILESPIFHP